MTHEDFRRILDRRIGLMMEVLDVKSAEYATGGDRLYNFKRAAEIGDTTGRKALYGMLLKHLVCVHDLCIGKLENTTENVDEKIGDTVNYLVLLEALLKEERDEEAKRRIAAMETSDE